MPLTSRWGTESSARDPLHLTSAPRPVVLDANRVTDSYRDFVCDDATKTGVFNLDCGAPPPPPAPPVTGPSHLGASVVEFNIAPLEAFHTNFIGSAPVGNDNIKFAEDIDSLTVHDGTDWHRFKEEE